MPLSVFFCCISHWCTVNTSNVIGLGAMFHHFEEKSCKLELLCYQDGNLIFSARCLFTHFCISILMVGGGFSLASAHLPYITVTPSTSSFYSSAPLGDYSSSLQSWLSPSRHSGTSCPSLLTSTPYDKLPRFTMPLGLDHMSVYQLCERGTSNRIHATQAILVGHYGQWSCYLFWLLLIHLAMCSIINMICLATHCFQKCNSGRITPFLASCNG